MNQEVLEEQLEISMAGQTSEEDHKNLPPKKSETEWPVVANGNGKHSRHEGEDKMTPAR